MSVLGRVVVSDFIPANMEISIRFVEEGLPSHVYPKVTYLKTRRYSKGDTNLRKTNQHFRIRVCEHPWRDIHAG